MLLTTVVNRHHGVPYDVYIGRGSPWGNPFQVGVDGSRDDVVDKYRAWFRDRVKEPTFRAETIALRGKRICCSCSPARCHGDIIVEWLHHPASLLTLTQDSDDKYGSRTRKNARAADLTAAFAVNYKTRGEWLTQTVAGDRYVAVPLGTPVLDAAHALAAALYKHDAKILNVAGNGLHTLSRLNWGQRQVDQWVFDVIKTTLATDASIPLVAVRSGGQTGADLAGGIAALALGLPATLLFPKGFLQRDAAGRDATHSFAEIWKQIEEGLAALKPAGGTQPGSNSAAVQQQLLPIG